MSAITPPSAPMLAASGGGDYWDRRDYGLTHAAWLRVGVLALLFVALFWSNLWRLWQKTNPFTGEGNWEHAIFIPLLGLYYLYVNSDDLLRRRVEPLRTGAWSSLRIALAAVAATLAIVWYILPILSVLLPSLPDPSRVVSDSTATAISLVLPLALWCVLALPQPKVGRWWISAAFVVAGLFCQLVLSKIAPGQEQRVVAAGVALSILGVLAAGFNWGIATTVFGIGLFGYGIWPGQNDYVKDVGMVITLFGMVLTLCGWDVMKVAWFPIAFLIFALPWPGLVYSWVAMPLQEIAAKVSVTVLQVTGVTAQVMGTKIVMAGEGGEPRTLNVAEACAGLKSLMTFLTVGAAMAFLSARPLWQKIIITLSAVPIAIGCNTMRVAGQGLLDYYWSREISQGFAHQFSGLIMLIPAFFLLLLVGWILDKLFIEEVDDKASLVAAAQTNAAGVAAKSASVVTAPPPGGAPRRQAPVIIAPPPPAGGSLRPKKANPQA